MKCAAQLAGMLLLGWSCALLAQPTAEPDGADTPSQNGGRAPRLLNPGNVVQRLLQMTPEQRERAMEKLAPPRREQILRRLQQFDRLPQPERERQLRLGQMFAKLPPDRQELVRRQIQAFNQMPGGRRRLVGAAFQRLRRLPDDERQVLLASELFRRRYTQAELQMLADLSENLPPPTVEPHP